MIASKEEQEKRQKFCNECSSNFMGVCRKCGCFILLKVKVEKTDCPMKKWEIKSV